VTDSVPCPGPRCRHLGHERSRSRAHGPAPGHRAQRFAPAALAGHGRGTITALALTLLLLAWASPSLLAQDGGFVTRGEGMHIADEARIIDEVSEATINEMLVAFEEETGVDIAVYTHTRGKPGTRKDARQDATALLEAWKVGGDDGLGAVIFWNVNQSGSITRNGVALGSAFDQDLAKAADDAVSSAIKTPVADQDWVGGLRVGVLELQNQLIDAGLPQASAVPSPAVSPAVQPRATPRSSGSGTRPTAGLSPPPGPPFPEPMTDVAVYDYAQVIDPAIIERLEADIDAIEARTGAEIVIYTQVDPSHDDPARTEQDARALIDQWGVGRQGFDDGLAVFFNLTDDKCHGQAQLYAAPGYEAAYLSNSERQAIFDEDMLPALRDCDFGVALTAAMRKIDAAATADHARRLQLARQVDAAAGLIVAPLLLVGLVGWAGWSWLRYGRDPIYVDDDSILMPAPPPGMSPAVAAVVLDGRAKRHALTTALVDLAARGEISFRAAEHDPSRLTIDITVPDQRDARLARNRRLPLGPAEAYALAELRKLGGAIRTIDPDEVPRFAKAVSGFEDRVEEAAAAHRWFSEAPGEAIDRWSRRGALVLIAGVVGIIIGANLPSSGLLLVGVAATIGAVAMLVIARTMPQRTLEGARMYAQLAAYRRTLQRTLEASRTMEQVVGSKALPWAETPDQAVVWAYALGLHEEAEEVLERSLEDVRTGAASPTRTYFPLWYSLGDRPGGRISGGSRAPTAGLFSSGIVPDFTAMTAALSTIGSPPVSSGGSGGGGFGGGSSGGGGGGAGGGF
jgi:uncharacterized membrane protein YgcG